MANGREGGQTDEARATRYHRELRQLEQHLQPFLREGFFFVNIGANDGVTSDPIYPFARKYQWRGLAVEPVPYVFERLRENYRDLPGVSFENVAVSSQPLTLWYVEEGSGSLDYIVNQIGSLDREHTLATLNNLRYLNDAIPWTPPRGAEPEPEPAPEPVPDDGVRIRDDVEDYLREIEIECVSFDDLMAKHHVDHIDYLNLDTEGCDFEIYRSIDFSRFRPQVLCVETSEFPEGGLEEMEEHLRTLDYSFKQTFGIFSRVYMQPGSIAAGSIG